MNAPVEVLTVLDAVIAKLSDSARKKSDDLLRAQMRGSGHVGAEHHAALALQMLDGAKQTRAAVAGLLIAVDALLDDDSEEAWTRLEYARGRIGEDAW